MSEYMEGPPIFRAVLNDTPDEQRPTFEPVVKHEEFLARHKFAEWLHETFLLRPKKMTRREKREARRIKAGSIRLIKPENSGLGWPEQ